MNYTQMFITNCLQVEECEIVNDALSEPASNFTLACGTGNWRSLPVIRDKQFELSDMGRILWEDNVACELGRRKPEWEIWRLIQLELCMDSGIKRSNQPSSLFSPNLSSLIPTKLRWLHSHRPEELWIIVNEQEWNGWTVEVLYRMNLLRRVSMLAWMVELWLSST